MDDDIAVSSNGRSEMRVFIDVESVVVRIDFVTEVIGSLKQT